MLERKSKGELKISGSDDVLSKALKTAEHTGRVRGVGGFVNPSTYFNLPKQKRVRITKADLLARDQERALEFEQTTKMLQEQQAKTEDVLLKKIAQLEALMMRKTTDAPATNVPHEGENVVSPISDKASFYDTKQSITDYVNDLVDGKMGEKVNECEIITHPQSNNYVSKRLMILSLSYLCVIFAEFGIQC